MSVLILYLFLKKLVVAVGIFVSGENFFKKKSLKRGPSGYLCVVK